MYTAPSRSRCGRIDPRGLIYEVWIRRPAGDCGVARRLTTREGTTARSQRATCPSAIQSEAFRRLRDDADSGKPENRSGDQAHASGPSDVPDEDAAAGDMRSAAGEALIDWWSNGDVSHHVACGATPLKSSHAVSTTVNTISGSHWYPVSGPVNASASCRDKPTESNADEHTPSQAREPWYGILR